MRFSILSLLLMMCLIAAATDEKITTEKEKEDMQRRLRVLFSRNLATLDISAASKEEFTTYMSGYCMKTEQMNPSDYLNNYISWEQVEFLDGVRNFLDPMNSEPIAVGSYFHHPGYEVASNCSVINEKKQRDTHHTVAQAALFDNYMYDQMTRNEWTRLPL